jgi:hypothetical protein
VVTDEMIEGLLGKLDKLFRRLGLYDDDAATVLDAIIAIERLRNPSPIFFCPPAPKSIDPTGW